MLGDSSLPVQLGGIVALERLAEDHPADFQHEAFKLLLEFVRTPPVLQQAQPKVWDGWLQLERPATRRDVQAAVEVIARLERLPRIGDDRSYPSRFPVRSRSMTHLFYASTQAIRWPTNAAEDAAIADKSAARLQGSIRHQIQRFASNVWPSTASVSWTNP